MLALPLHLKKKGLIASASCRHHSKQVLLSLIKHRFYVTLPDVQAHSNHSCEGAAGYAQILHSLVIQEIKLIVYCGITKVRDVRSSLKRFVQTKLTIAGGIKPNETNRDFYPTGNDIKNHIYLV